MADVSRHSRGAHHDQSAKEVGLLMRLVPLLLLLLSVLSAEDSLKFTQPEIPLWTSTAPRTAADTSAEKWNPSTDGFHRVTNIHAPSMFVFLPPPERATGTAVLIFPGGGHRYLVMDLEGSLVAGKLNAMGIAAFIVKTRLSRAEGSTYTTAIESLQDAQRAIRIVRSRAKEWHVDPAKVGVMGFSAGGEIAALAETRFETAPEPAGDSIDKRNARPDFAVLAYPGLRGGNISVSKTTPPTFIVVAADDDLSVASSEYFAKLKSAGVSVALHIFNRGGHGFGMTGRTPAFLQLPAARWPDLLQDWLMDQGFLPKRT